MFSLFLHSCNPAADEGYVFLLQCKLYNIPTYAHKTAKGAFNCLNTVPVSHFNRVR